MLPLSTPLLLLASLQLRKLGQRKLFNSRKLPLPLKVLLAHLIHQWLDLHMSVRLGGWCPEVRCRREPSNRFRIVNYSMMRLVC
jgi:hypothetical protein